MTRLCFVGDIMPGGVLPYQEDYVSEEVRQFLSSFDLRIGTLETAIGNDISFDTEKMSGRANIIYARDEDLDRVSELGFDIVSLANNHVCDLGKDGLRNTISQLDCRGIMHCGVGLTADEAARPAVVTLDGKRLAFFAYCMYGNKYLGHVRLATKNLGG